MKVRCEEGKGTGAVAGGVYPQPGREGRLSQGRDRRNNMRLPVWMFTSLNGGLIVLVAWGKRGKVGARNEIQKGRRKSDVAGTERGKGGHAGDPFYPRRTEPP